MAETLPNGVVIPQGEDLINSNGVQAMRNLGSSVDSQLANRALVGHTHSWEQVTGKPATFPPSTHTHPVSQVTGLQAALDAKAATAHTHTVGNVTGLQAALDQAALTAEWAQLVNKPTSFPPVAHTHDDRYYTETEVGPRAVALDEDGVPYWVGSGGTHFVLTDSTGTPYIRSTLAWGIEPDTDGTPALT